MILTSLVIIVMHAKPFQWDYIFTMCVNWVGAILEGDECVLA